MLVPAVVAPLSVLYTVGPISLAILPLAGIVVAIELKLGVNAGNPGLPEYICSAGEAGQRGAWAVHTRAHASSGRQPVPLAKCSPCWLYAGGLPGADGLGVPLPQSGGILRLLPLA